MVEAREEPEEPASFQREESRPVRAYPSGGAAKEIAPPAVADAGADVGEARDAAYADSFGRSAFETGVQTYSAGLNPEAVTQPWLRFSENHLSLIDLCFFFTV